MGNTEQRLQVLESQFRRARHVNRCLALLLVAILCMAGAQNTTPADPGQKTPKSDPQSDRNLPNDRVPPESRRLRTVEADQFVLFDRLGRTRARLAVDDDGAALSMFDDDP